MKKQKSQTQIVFQIQSQASDGYQYIFLSRRQTIAKFKHKHHATLFAWAVAVKPILTDVRMMAFANAVTGLLTESASSLNGHLNSQKSNF